MIMIKLARNAEWLSCLFSSLSSLLNDKRITVKQLYAIISHYILVVSSGTSTLKMPRLAWWAFIKEAIIFTVHGESIM